MNESIPDKQLTVDSRDEITGTASTHRIPSSGDSDEKKAVRSVFNSLCADWGSQFLGQFQKSDGYTQNSWLWNMYKRCYGCSAKSILVGYEKVVSGLNNSRMPTTTEIVKSIRQVERGEEELKELSFNGGISGFVDSLEKANKGNPVAEREIKKIREILNSPPAKTETERAERMHRAVTDHESLLDEHQRKGKIRATLLHSNPACAFPGCAKPGTMANSTNGSSHWYCAKHFSRK